MKKFFLLAVVSFFVLTGFSQDLAKFHAYHPDENAKKEIAEAVRHAKKENKHVLIQIGGNWCIWCARFIDFVESDKSLDSTMKANYIVYHLNYSKENYNGPLLAKYGFPQRFGFPVFLILDGKGYLLHTQNTGYLEEGKSYSKQKVSGFLIDWSPNALDAKNYTDK